MINKSVKQTVIRYMAFIINQQGYSHSLIYTNVCLLFKQKNNFLWKKENLHFDDQK